MFQSGSARPPSFRVTSEEEGRGAGGGRAAQVAGTIRVIFHKALKTEARVDNVMV